MPYLSRKYPPLLMNLSPHFRHREERQDAALPQGQQQAGADGQEEKESGHVGLICRVQRLKKEGSSEPAGTTAEADATAIWTEQHLGPHGTGTKCQRPKNGQQMRFEIYR